MIMARTVKRRNQLYLTFLGSFLGFQQKGVTMSIVLYNANGNTSMMIDIDYHCSP